MALNEYFASTGVVDNGIAPHMPSRVQPGVSLSGAVFTEAKVRAAIKKLKSNTASGVDGWPPLLFKKLINSPAHPLALLFQSFFSVGKIPVQWKQAIITSVYKSGSSSEMNNYRPISLTCVASKLMERGIVVNILSYLKSHNLISAQQHGFMMQKSTVWNLLEAVNDWTIAINDKKSVVIAYIHCESKKLGHFYFYCNFGKCWSIFKILLRSESEGNS